MIHHYIKYISKTISSNKSFFLIDILGLALGMALAFIVLYYVLYETSYDNCHLKNNRIFRINTIFQEWQETTPSSQYILGPTLKNSLPEVETYTRCGIARNISIKKNNEFINEPKFQFAENTLFDIFTIPLLIGNPDELFTYPNSVIISERIASKYFNNSNPVGKQLEVEIRNETFNFFVSGVFKNMPGNSTYQADFIGNLNFYIEYLKKRFDEPNLENDWRFTFFTTYVLLQDNADIQNFEHKLASLSEQHSLEYYKFEYEIQMLEDIYLFSSHLTSINTKTGSLSNIYLFSFIAVLILILSGGNTIILYIAHSSGRLKEFGIRKVFGANRALLAKQILIESNFIGLFALPLAVIISLLFLPIVDNLFNGEIEITASLIWKYLLGFLFITFLIGMLSGGYIAFYILSLNPADSLRNKWLLGKKKLLFNRFIIIIQILIFSGLITTLLFVVRQIHFCKNESMGFNMHDLIVIDIDPDEFKDYKQFKNELKNISTVINVTGGWGIPPTNELNTDLMPSFDDPDEEILVDLLEVDYDFFQTYEIPILEGSGEWPDYENDSICYIVVNEDAVYSLGLEDPVGKVLDDYYKVIGIVSDFHIQSFNKEKLPIVIILLEPKWIHEIVVRIKHEGTEKTLDLIKEKWIEFAPQLNFEFQMMDQIVDNLYSKEKDLRNVLSFFAILGVIISSIGLFGLNSLVAKRKSKEIAIRKVNGASVADILLLFLKEYLILCFLASILSWPIVYFFINKWLQNFITQIDILSNSWIFLISMFLTTSIVLGTVFLKALQAAKSNPAESIKYE